MVTLVIVAFFVPAIFVVAPPVTDGSHALTIGSLIATAPASHAWTRVALTRGFLGYTGARRSWE